VIMYEDTIRTDADTVRALYGHGDSLRGAFHRALRHRSGTHTDGRYTGEICPRERLSSRVKRFGSIARTLAT